MNSLITVAIINETECKDKNVHLWIVLEIFKINKYS